MDRVVVGVFRKVLEQHRDDRVEQQEEGEHGEAEEEGHGTEAAAVGPVVGAQRRLGRRTGQLAEPVRAVRAHLEVVHDAVPALAGGTAEEGDHSDAEPAEVSILGEEVVEAHVVEELHSEHGVDEEQQQ